MTCAVLAFVEGAAPAARLAAALGIPCHAVDVHRFPDGESLVRVEQAPRTAFLYRSLDRPNDKALELLLAASALRDGGTTKLVLVIPYLAYMRQDIAFHPGEAVSQRVFGDLLARACDALLTVDPHLHRTHSLAEIMPGIEARAVPAAEALAPAFATMHDPLLVGPDEESRQWVEAVARPLGLEVLLGGKQRRGDREVVLTIPEVGRVAGRTVVLVDDLISSGATMAAAARVLRASGATRIEALATHCLAGPAALEQLRRAGVAAIRSTDTVPGPTGSLAVAGLLARTIRDRGWLA